MLKEPSPRRCKMRKHWLIVTIASLLAVAGLSGCGNADAQTAEIDCDGNVAEQISTTEAELDDAKSDAKDSEGSPAETAANERVAQLEAHLDELHACVQPVETTTTIPASAGTNVVVDSASLKEVFEGPVDPTAELAFGEAATATLATAPQERGAAAHSAQTLMSGKDVVAWFNSGDSKAVVVRDRVFLHVTAMCGTEDAARIISGEGWLIMAVLPPSQVLGTSYMTDAGMVFAESWRSTGEGDGYGLPVCLSGPNKGKVVAEGMVRLDCGNGHNAPKIRVVRPDTPPAPPVEQPPTVEEQPPTPEGGKDHRKSPVSSDPDAEDERVRPVIPAPPEVIRPPDAPPPPAEPPATPPGQGDSGSGGWNTVPPPTTVAPAPAPPTTSPPTTNPPPPPPGSF
jgi:hypothetical protein